MKIVDLLNKLLRKPKRKQVNGYNCWTIRLPIDMDIPNDDSNIDKSSKLKKVSVVEIS